MYDLPCTPIVTLLCLDDPKHIQLITNTFSYTLYEHFNLVLCHLRIFGIHRCNINFFDDLKHPRLFIPGEFDIPVLSLPQLPHDLKVLNNFMRMLRFITGSGIW